MKKPFFYELDYSAAFFANMTSRLSKMINDEFSEVLKDSSIVTPITDVSLVMFLAQSKGASIAEIAKALSYSHQRTASRVSALEKLSLIYRHTDLNDGRCQRFTLTKLGVDDVAELTRITKDVASVINEISKEQSVQIMEVLFGFCQAIENEPISARIKKLPNSRQGEIK
ncbi:MarR family winged helix-turn-helix transcriptional regulator [Brumicola blandensis]|jgi:DNA-binding MarR family transcriptional regulator|uniref:MarR family transcriptional regulator n=2 Tax=Alteromonadaceae TaxID=72275 RepID=A0AAW8R4N3_9ALTE|nr:MarR family transcriptional regulator [Alteromonas sp. W409]MDT0583379.1 MarR family transcriptional regulator [Alteromonas sp. W409]